MSTAREILTITAAKALVLSHTPGPREERLGLAHSLHRIIVRDLKATCDSPPFDKSLMDGFAISLGALKGAGRVGTCTLTVAETVTAGRLPTVSVSDTVAVRIMTGSPVPDGCDCVVPIEQVQFDEARPDEVTVSLDALSPDQCLMRQGTAARAGQPLLRSGSRLCPQQIAALAEFGITEIVAGRRPTVAVLATGDELVPADQAPSAGQIRNSNEPMLAALAQQSGAQPVPLGIARDNAESLRERIAVGLQHDILLLSGGVSAGTLDLVPSQLQAAGVQQVFHGVDLKPGRPLWFGVRNGDAPGFAAGASSTTQPHGEANSLASAAMETATGSCLVFGLPGNPVSSLTCFQLFVVPAIRRLQGIAECDQRLTATLLHDKAVGGSRPVWHPAVLSLKNGRLEASLVPWSGSSDLRATVEANGMCLLQPDHGPYRRATCWNARSGIRRVNDDWRPWQAIEVDAGGRGP